MEYVNEKAKLVFTDIPHTLHATDINKVVAVAEEIYDEIFHVDVEDKQISAIIDGARQSFINNLLSKMIKYVDNNGNPVINLENIPTIPSNKVYDEAFTYKDEYGHILYNGATQSQINRELTKLNDLVLLLKATGIDAKTLEEILEAIRKEIDEKIAETCASKEDLNKKQDKLTPGDNITIVKNEQGETIISAEFESEVTIEKVQELINESYNEIIDILERDEEQIYSEINNLNAKKQDRLTPGDNISIETNESGETIISASVNIPEEELRELIEEVKEEVESDLSGITAELRREITEGDQEILAKIKDNEKVISNAINYLNKNKQDNLKSGENIKTINGQSILGEGNIEIQGGGGSTVYGDNTTIKIEDNIVSAIMDTSGGVASSDRVFELEIKNASFNTSLSPIYFETGVETTVTASASISDLNGCIIKINDEVRNTLTEQISSQKSYVFECYYGERLLSATTQTVKTYNRTYYGFGTSPEYVINNGNSKVTSNACGSYTNTATENGVNYYILVPNGVSCPTQFTMNAAPFVMSSETKVINEITYTVLKSGSMFNTGGEVNIKAE